MFKKELRFVLFWTIFVAFLVFSSSFLIFRASGGMEIFDRQNISRSKDLEQFKSVEIYSNISVEIFSGEENKVELEGGQGVLDLIKIKQDGEQISISQNSNFSFDGRIPSINFFNDEVKVKLYTNSDIQKIAVSGVSEVSLNDGMNCENLEFIVSGAGEIKTGEFACSKIDIEVSGIGEVNAKKVEAGEVSIDLSGAGEVEVYATEKLFIDISGAGEVQYLGSPELEQNISGAGSVKKIR